MQPVKPEYDVGVIVGRFQVHELHDGHRNLIDYVARNHRKVVILLGLAPLPASTYNPLDFESRKQMLLAEFPDVSVLYIKDQPTDGVWSKRLDEIVRDLITPGQSVILYGGRDSFIDHYEGRFPTQELLQAEHYSGGAIRKQIAKSSTRASADFRAGVIWAATARFPTTYTTVDVALFDHDGKRILLGRKANERLYRFIGGFSDPSSDSFEADAKRELREEAGPIEAAEWRYVGSCQIDDWRYRREPDHIKTLLFTARYLWGAPEPGDDIEELKWFDWHRQNTKLDSLIVPNHRPLMAMLREEGPQ